MDKYQGNQLRYPMNRWIGSVIHLSNYWAGLVSCTYMYLFILFCFKYGKTALDFAESFGRKVSKKMRSELVKLWLITAGNLRYRTVMTAKTNCKLIVRCFKLHRYYSNPLNLSIVTEVFWIWIIKLQVQNVRRVITASVKTSHQKVSSGQCSLSIRRSI